MAAKKRASKKSTNVNGSEHAPAPDISTARGFIREFALRQKLLLDTIASQVNAGQLNVEATERADELIEDVISEWCDDADPTEEQHMRMLGAVFYLALLDKLFGDEQDDDSPRSAAAPGGANLNDLMMEALKTARSIWGR